MSIPLPTTDPAYWMLERGREDPSLRSKRHVEPRDGCYICTDLEFELMGLPLCRECPICTAATGDTAGHIAADDTVCDDCGFDEYDDYMKRMEELHSADKEVHA